MAADPAMAADPTFLEWARNPNRRPSIWTWNGDVQELSQHFLSIFRPILLKAFQCLKLDYNRGYKYPNLLSSVRIEPGNRVHVPDPQDEGITCPNDIHDIIKALRDLLDIALKGEPSDEDVPSVMMFKRLCSKALRCSNMTKLRICGYFITLNPLIYTVDEWYMFVEKTWFIYNEDSKQFQSSVTLRLLTEFPRNVCGDKSSFEDVYLYQYRNYGNLPSSYYPRRAAVGYMGAIRRHHDRKKSQISMIMEMRRRLPGYVPVLFEEMVWACCMKGRLIPPDIFGPDITLRNPKSLISRMSGSPFPNIISPDHIDVENSRIRR